MQEIQKSVLLGLQFSVLYDYEKKYNLVYCKVRITQYNVVK